MISPLRERLLSAVQKAYQRYVNSGPRSTSKIKALHGWVIDELESILGIDYQIQGLSDSGGGEAKVQGKYYPKNVDVAIWRSGTTLGVVSVKFVMTNYNQNKTNYFEQQLGETANLRSNDIVFGHIMLRTHPTPYLKRDGVVKQNEQVNDGAIELYARLAQDHGKHHVPDIQCEYSKQKSHRLRAMGATDYERWEPPNTIDVSHPFRRRSRAQYVCKTGCIMRWIRSSIFVENEMRHYNSDLGTDGDCFRSTTVDI